MRPRPGTPRRTKYASNWRRSSGDPYGSTRPRGRSTPRTRRTTGRCRSASSCRATPTTSLAAARGLPQPRRAGRCRAAPAPASPARPVNVAVVLDFSRYLNASSRSTRRRRRARVQPGVVLRRACATAAAPHGLTFGPDPSTHNRCTLGGMIGNNACGAHSVAWGKTVDNVRGARRLALGRHAAHAAARRPTTTSPGGARTGGRPAISTAACATCATARRPDRAPPSPRSRGGCPATTSTSCCRRTASTWRGRWSAPRAPARRCSRPSSTWSRRRPPARWWCWASPTFRRRRRACRGPRARPARRSRARRGDRRQPARAPPGRPRHRPAADRQCVAVRRDRR